MSWGTLTLGALSLKETYALEDAVNETSGARKVSLSGRETTGWATRTRLREIAEDLITLRGKYLALTFSNKTDRDGFYRLDDVNTSVLDWGTEGASLDWQMDFTFMGPENAVEVESRLSSVVRANDFSATGERWHAPAGGAYAYWTGSTSGTPLTRTGEAGALTVYRSVPAGISPRWGASPSGFQAGRVRLLVNSVERMGGSDIRVGPTNWELNNGLVKVNWSTGALQVSVWSEGVWQAKKWGVFHTSGSQISGFDQAVILRNDNEVSTIRLIESLTGGRVMLDLTLRRGSRFVEGYMTRHSSADELKVRLEQAETYTNNSSSGYLVGDQDVNGIRFAAGSSKTFLAHANGGIIRQNATALDFWLGAEVPGVSVGGTNNGFELGNTSTWTSPSPGSATLVVDTANVKFGTYSGKMTANGGTSQARVETSPSNATAGKQYVVSGWVMSPVALTAGKGELTVHWYNGTTFLSSNNVLFPALSANVWTPIISPAFTAPANTTRIARQVALDGTPAAGAVLYADQIDLREFTDSGDTAATLQAQYIAAYSEQTVVVPR